MATLTAPLRILLRADITWYWMKSLSDCVVAIKSAISSAPALRIFDGEKPIMIQYDTSQESLGCCLLHYGQPIAFASRSLTETEKKWAQIEKELLVVVDATKKFHYYVYGCIVQILTDHLKLKLLKYNVEVQYLPGKMMHIIDLLSLAYNKEEVEDDEINVQKEEFRRELVSDSVPSEEVKLVKTGWSRKKSSIPVHCLPYWSVQSDNFVEDGLLFLNDKIVIPKNLRPNILKVIHEGHFVVGKTKSRARRITNRKEQLIPHSVSKLPLHSKQSGRVISVLKSIFYTHGIPKIIITDNMPFNSYECQHFPCELDFEFCYIQSTLPIGKWYGRKRVRTRIPRTTNNLTPKAKVKNHYNRQAQRKPIDYSKCQVVVVQKGRVGEPATIVEKYKTTPSYRQSEAQIAYRAVKLYATVGRDRDNTDECRENSQNPDIIWEQCHEEHVVTRGSYVGDHVESNFIPETQSKPSESLYVEEAKKREGEGRKRKVIPKSARRFSQAGRRKFLKSTLAPPGQCQC
ncbi:hypothetical protein PR048_001216 [Dryococelus australis]|uniref:Reverse transcriptase RNase H-like domain-containing protein n=1 Tax=Dryococelus australis TaxID=614101 RepID=A0ABQ9IGU7_9NEOP|nr:hypothetical protein PR048_001216 [Dryococelus australis]